MANLLLFKIAQFLVTLGFVFFISDLRRKEGCEPLIDEKFVWAMKLSYLIPITIYFYTLVTLGKILPIDFAALLLTLLGAIMVIKAKIDLGNYHIWTGYKREEIELVVKGIYRWMRHPMYLGIFIFIFGAILTVIPHLNNKYLLIPFFLCLSYIIGFLTIAAKKETAFLEKKFGDRFSRYFEQIHPFFPLNKYED